MNNGFLRSVPIAKFKKIVQLSERSLGLVTEAINNPCGSCFPSVQVIWILLHRNTSLTERISCNSLSPCNISILVDKNTILNIWLSLGAFEGSWDLENLNGCKSELPFERVLFKEVAQPN